MLNKLASLALVAALVTFPGGTIGLARSSSHTDLESDRPEAKLLFVDEAIKRPAANEELRTEILRLVAKAKAGKVKPAERPQIQPARSNNLSKGAKIAIGVGIAVAVVAVILIASHRAPFD